MKLTEQEKELIRKIADDSIQSFYDYWVFVFSKVEQLKNDVNELRAKGIRVNDEVQSFIRGGTYFGLEDKTKRKQLFEDIIVFIRIIKTLEEKKLIFCINTHTTSYPALLFKDLSGKYSFDRFLRTNRLITEFKDTLIFRNPELITFVENGFRTKEEVAKDEEVKHRIKSYNLTMIIAIASIFVSLIATVFNIFLSNKNREVHITNPGPTEIRITNIDSLQQIPYKNSDTLKVLDTLKK